ncbi:nucleotidyltransferase substrate binding protein [Piscirickettsia salmonis]|uniref:nucleotidyltransferase substrate binding protein n=1 Tax=Piscirickettsia salmonis TaxID=1238 RepID=UPI003EBF56B7
MTQNQNRPRWVESLENYSKALDSLNKVVELSQQKTLSEFEQDSLIKRFEFTYEEAVKTLTRYLEYEGHHDLKGSRTAFRRGVKINLLTDGQDWMDMIECRNAGAHNYSDVKAEKISEKVLNTFYPMLVDFKKKLSDLMEDKG